MKPVTCSRCQVVTDDNTHVTLTISEDGETDKVYHVCPHCGDNFQRFLATWLENRQVADASRTAHQTMREAVSRVIKPEDQ